MEITVRNKSIKKAFERIFGIPYFDIFSIISYVIPLSYIIFFLILPVLEMLTVGFRYEGHFSLHWFKTIFTDSYYINLNPQGTFYTATDKYILVTGVNF
ncbi:MAG: iron ABC transporter permease, partial [Thermoprotei archaeon]